VRNFRRLPPLLRVSGILGLLLALTSVGLLTQAFLTSLSTFPNWPLRTSVIGMNLGMLGAACSVVVQAYSRRFRQPGRGPFPLNSWLSQLRALALVAALPLCALAWAVFIPSTQPGYGNVYLICTLAALVLLGVYLWPIIRGLPELD
jgi:hypothetical protein